MAPKIPCPNCQEDEWLENNELSYLPQVVKLKDGKYVATIRQQDDIKRSLKKI